MTAAATIAALPVAFLTILALLRVPAVGRRLVATPSDDRWHTRETPTFGGVGIFLGLVAGAGAAFATGYIEPSREVLAILAGCALLFAAGLIDDIYRLNPLAKLGAQVAAAAIVLAGGLEVEVIANQWIGIPLAMLWLVGVTNAFNLLDNMDGLAATLAAIAAAYFAVAAVIKLDDRPVLVLSLALAFALVGFLPFNLRRRGPAAIFMGDSGSQVLGFALASLGLLGSWKEAGTAVATLLLPILVLAVPILDTALVTLVRLLEGRPVTQGGRDHTSHRLVYQGLSEKRAVVMLAVIAAALGATSLGYTVIGNGRLTAFGVLVTFAALLQFGSFLGDVRGREAHGLLVHRRLLVEALVDAALVAASLYAAYLLVVQGDGTMLQRYVFTLVLGVVLAARYVFFIGFGLYRAVWRYAGARDALGIVIAVVLSEAAAYVFLRATIDLHDFPHSIFVIDALIATLLIGGSRFGERALVGALSSLRSSEERTRAVIVGAGRSGRSLLRELRETPGDQVVGFVDDDPLLRGRRIQGVRVLGGTEELEHVLARVRPHAVFVTIPNADAGRLEAIVAACGAVGVDCRFVRRHVELQPAVAAGAE